MASKIYKFCVLQITFFSLKFVWTVFISSTELSSILAKYFTFSQLHLGGF